MTTVTAQHYKSCSESHRKERLKRKALRQPRKTDTKGVDVRDVTELANIRIRRMRISCAKSVGCRCGFVAQSKLLAIVGFVATVIQVIQLS